MSDLLHQHLNRYLRSCFERHRVVLWEDPSGALEPLLRENLPDGVTMPRFEGNLLSLRQQIDSEDPWLERRWLLYVPALPSGVGAEWLADYGQGFHHLPQADFAWALVHFYDLTLSAELRALLRGPSATRLAAELHRFVGPEMARLREEDVLSALLKAAINAPGAEEADLAVRYLVEGDRAFPGLLPALTSVIKKRLGLKRHLVDGQAPDRGALARCLVASCLVESDAAPAALLANHLPEAGSRPRWRRALESGMKEPGLRDRLLLAVQEQVQGASFWESLTDPAALAAGPALDIVDDRVLELLLQRDVTDQASWWTRVVEVSGRRAEHTHLAPAVKARWTAIRAAASLLGRTQVRFGELATYPTASLPRLVQEYTAPEGDWQVDALYRVCAQAPPGMPLDVEESLLRPAREAYHRWTREQTRRLVGAVESAGYAVGGALRHAQFWTEMVDRPGRLAVLIVDALRADLAMELASRLRHVGRRVQARTALAELPTRTEVGMAALLPRAHEGFSVKVEAGRLVASIGATRVAGTEERVRYEAKAPLTHPVERRHLNEWLADGGRSLGVAIREGRLALAHTTDIDEGGEIAASVDFQLFDKVLDLCERFVGQALDVGYTEVVVAGDHGFLVRDPEAVTLGVPGTESSGGKLARGLRYAAGSGTVGADLVTFPAKVLGRGGDAVHVPRDTACLAVPGGAGLFVHGGLSLQECVLAFLSVTAQEAAAPDRLPVRLSVPERATSLGFKVGVAPQAGGLPLFAADRTVVLRLQDAAGRTVGGQERELVLKPGGGAQTVLLTAPAAGTYRVTLWDVGQAGPFETALIDIEVMGGGFEF